MSIRLMSALPSAIRAKVVQVGNSVGVRLPASLHLELGAEIEVTIRVIQVWPEGYSEMEPVGEDFSVPGREGAAGHEKRIKRLFGPKGSF